MNRTAIALFCLVLSQPALSQSLYAFARACEETGWSKSFPDSNGTDIPCWQVKAVLDDDWDVIAAYSKEWKLARFGMGQQFYRDGYRQPAKMECFESSDLLEKIPVISCPGLPILTPRWIPMVEAERSQR